MNLSDLMTTSAARHGDRTAIRQGDVALTYTALERASRAGRRDAPAARRPAG